MSKIVVVGSGFAGLTAALELRRLLPDSEQVTVVSATDTFFFAPSLIWVMQGWRELEDLSFPVRPILEEAGIEFVQAKLAEIQPNDKRLRLTNDQDMVYDKLLLATGGEWQWDALPGLQPKPDGHTISILTPRDAFEARPYWQDLIENPGPVVIGLALGAGLYGAAYEFALSLAQGLKHAGVQDRVRIQFVTPEPFLGHFGHGGLGNSQQVLEDAFLKNGITWLVEAQISGVTADHVIVAPNRHLPSHFTMIVPPYQGIRPLRDTPNLTDENGRIPINDYGRSQTYPDIFVAGVAAQIPLAQNTLLPCGRLVAGTMSARMGRHAAATIAADLGIGEATAMPLNELKAYYVLDSGSHGLLMSLGSESWLNLHLNIPGPWSHWAKSISEKYQMWQLQTGRY